MKCEVCKKKLTKPYIKDEDTKECFHLECFGRVKDILEKRNYLK